MEKGEGSHVLWLEAVDMGKLEATLKQGHLM